MFGPVAQRFCAQLGIDYPLVQAPMAGGFAPPELVAAVSNSGGLGSLPATFLSPDQITAAIDGIRASTGKPFGVNFLLAPPEELNQAHAESMQRVLAGLRDRLELPAVNSALPTLPPSPLNDQLRVVADQHVPVVSFSMGLPPAETVGMLRESGAFVIIGVTTVDEAISAVANGADAVVTQGFEAGGHRFTFDVSGDEPLPLVGTLALVPQVADAVSAHVIAAGGIMDGRGMVAALALGASAVQMGTRFLMASEVPAFPSYRKTLLSSSEADTAITRAFTGRPARGLRNSLVREVESSGVDPLPWPYQAIAADDVYTAAAQRNDAGWFTVWAGQGLRMLKAEQPAAEIVREVVAEAQSVIGGLGD